MKRVIVAVKRSQPTFLISIQFIEHRKDFSALRNDNLNATSVIAAKSGNEYGKRLPKISKEILK